MKALILAAGEGTRLRPLTLDRPKPMLLIGGKPLLEHLVTWLRRHGITDVAINLHHKPESVTDYFGDGRRFGASITYSYEERLLGTAGAAKKLQPFFDDTFVVVYGDVFTNLNLTRLITFHNKHRSGRSPTEPEGEPEVGPSSPSGSHRSGRSLTEPDEPEGQRGKDTFTPAPLPPCPPAPFLTLALYHVENPTACGLAELDSDGRVLRFVEKPPPDQVFTDLANTGVLVVEPGILDYIPPNTFCDFGHDLFPQLMNRGVALYGYPLQDGEFLIDIGTPTSYRRAQELQRP